MFHIFCLPFFPIGQYNINTQKKLYFSPKTVLQYSERVFTRNFKEGFITMKTGTIILLVALTVFIIATVILYFVGKKAQKKQSQQQEMMQANKMSVSMLIIDKKRMKLKNAGLPPMVLEQTPKMLRGAKMPIVKAKVGPQIVSLVCDEKIFDSIPVKKEVKASVSGIYILEVKGLHGKNQSKTETKKKGFFKRAVEMAQEKAGAKPLK